VGESGCGKSTLGRLFLRLLEATSGQVLFEGRDILKYSPQEMHKIRREMQIIFQDPFSSLNPRMSVFELIAEPLITNKIYRTNQELTERILKLMEIVGLAERFVNTYPHEMDGGRRQRVGVARALALNPKFIVCDEPVSALDVSIQAQVLNLMQDLQQERGLTYIFITHDLSVVRHISNDIMVMYLGVCVEKAPSKELFKHQYHPYTKALISAIPQVNIDNRSQRILMKGELASPVNPPDACRFAPRCSMVRECCRQGQPVLRELTPGHFVSCFVATM